MYKFTMILSLLFFYSGMSAAADMQDQGMDHSSMSMDKQKDSTMDHKMKDGKPMSDSTMSHDKSSDMKSDHHDKNESMQQHDSKQAMEKGSHEMHNSMSDMKGMHHDMKKDAKKSSNSLVTLKTLPASGVSREGGYDGRYAMEATTVTEPLSDRCAKASRGIVMLDNKTWEKCGGKPDGLAKGTTGGSNSMEMMGHDMPMKH
ncbi:MAG: hypothetical protein ACC707_04335 [Thiohalomonadales bacterium]